MDDQCPIMNKSGEVMKKRSLSELDKGTSSKKYVYISTAAGLTYRFTTTSDFVRDQDHFFVEKAALGKDAYLAKNTSFVTRCNRISNTKINCVNDKCLAKIFMYLPACERPKLALVCKKWKNVLDDSWYDVKKLELIYWQYDESPNCLAKYSTSDGGYSFLKSLLNKCGRYLTKLDLTAYGNCNIVPVVNELCPNLVKLRLRFTKMDEVLLTNSFTRLSKLKSLTIIHQNKKFLPYLPTVALINSLRNVADTLTDFSFLNWVDELKVSPDFTDLIMDVVRDLKALESLELAGVTCSTVGADYLKDKNISYVNHTTDLLHYLPKSKPFEDMNSLQIVACRIKDNSLYSIANSFKNLKFLKIYSTWVTDDGVLALSKMNNLKILNFHGCNNITDSSIKLLKNLIKLNLPNSNKITDKSVITVLENSPKMDALDVHGSNVTAELVKKAANISRKRKQRLIFCVALMPDIKRYDSLYFYLHIYKKINGIPTPVPVSARAHPGSDSQRVQEGQAKVLQIIK
ncbi:F-box/LRR-repeat protein 2-like isoform X1 [Aphidius gifuensis]|uniref:F-box/LRR-repeat protein 2-like isoform X1 n=1 Tax=Aphidius gifuensis TaxID=684658 RepID=UPI001CDBF217|nr:F-box/LRR-repeat protein 2-like isoform X1 [Aphidius gifuensis]